PPQGGRLVGVDAPPQISGGARSNEPVGGGDGHESISPLEGEMSGRTAGGSQAFDPLDCEMAAPWTGPRPDALADLSDAPWRTNGDTVERLEMLATRLVSGAMQCPDDWTETRLVMEEVEKRLRPSIAACGPREIG